METSKINLANLVQSVSLCLAGNWTRHIDEGGVIRNVNLTRADGFKLHFSTEVYGKAGKLVIQFFRPRNAKGSWVELYEGHSRVFDPSINVSETKSAEQIAADITRRLMPEAEAIFAKVNAQVANENAAHSNRVATLREMTEAVGVTPNEGGHDERQFSFYLPVRNHTVLVEVNYGGTVQIKLPSLNPDKAKELIAFLLSNTFAEKIEA